MTGYFMEAPREAYRLAAKVDPDQWVAEHYGAYLKPGVRFLDVGCGPGVIADAAGRCGAWAVGLDRSVRRFEQRSSARWRVGGDAISLPFPNGVFDLVTSRFLLEYLPDKLSAVAEMARVAAPGGRVILHDLDGQLVWHDPPEPALEAGIKAVLDGLSSSGFDPHAGRALFHLARRADLTDITVNVRPYHLIAGRVDDAERALWELKLGIAHPAITAIVGRDEAHELSKRVLAYLDHPDTLTYSVLFTVMGTKPHRSSDRWQH